MAIERLSLNFCSRKIAAAGLTPSAEIQVAGDNTTPRVIGVNEAFRLSAQGSIVLIDVRRESEWRKTGIAVTAIPITMHQSMEIFVKQIGEATGEDSQTPIALICAQGVRSSYLQRALKGYELPQIIDVHEGMLGGPQNRGWIRSGLPVNPYDP